MINRLLILATWMVIPLASVASAFDEAKDWRELDTRSFSLSAPAKTIYEPRQGEDSFVGTFRGPGFLLEYDYGRYGFGDYQDDPQATKTAVVVDGRKAWIVTLDDKDPQFKNQPFFVGLYIPQAEFDQIADFSTLDARPSYLKLTILGHAKDSETAETVRQIFLTVHFHKKAPPSWPR